MNIKYKKIAYIVGAAFTVLCLLSLSIIWYVQYKIENGDVTLDDGYVVDGLVYSISKEIEERVEYLKIQNNINHPNYIEKFKYGYPLQLVYARNNAYLYKIKYKKKNLVFKFVNYKDLIDNEVKVTREVKHKNIVETYYAFYNKKKTGYFIVMEPMDQSLTLEYATKYPEEIKNITRSVVHALKYLNTKDIIHCDIKLDNILVKTVNNKKIYKICDFGGALYIKADKSKPPYYAYTPEYVAPETYYDGMFTRSTDIFQLGHTIWYYTLKKSVFIDRNGLSLRYEYIMYLNGLDSDITRTYKQPNIVKLCCALNPDDRISYDGILEWCDER